MRIIEDIRPSPTRRNPTRRFRPTRAGMKRILALGSKGQAAHGMFIQTKHPATLMDRAQPCESSKEFASHPRVGTRRFRPTRTTPRARRRGHALQRRGRRVAGHHRGPGAGAGGRAPRQPSARRARVAAPSDPGPGDLAQRAHALHLQKAVEVGVSRIVPIATHAPWCAFRPSAASVARDIELRHAVAISCSFAFWFSSKKTAPFAAAIPAASGLAALEVAPSFLPDAVVLDIGLREVYGYKVAQRPRRGKRVATTTWSHRVPEQHTAHPALAQVINHALAIGLLLPVRYGRGSIQFAHAPQQK